MVEIIFYGAIFIMGLQMAFGKIDESKIKPGVTVEEARKKNKTFGYIFMAWPFVMFIVRMMILS